MFDFLKAYPSITMEQYMWQMSVAQIALAKSDTTHVVYLSEEEAKKANAKIINSGNDLLNDFGFPIIKKD
jgi:hypothetical protein